MVRLCQQFAHLLVWQVEGPGVVLVLSSSEFNDVQLALSSTGGKSPMTLVFLDSPDADTHVFVESGRATAPDLRPAKLIALGPLIEAPHRIEPRAAAQFDHSPNVLGGATDVVVCRLTLVKEYCSLLRPMPGHRPCHPSPCQLWPFSRSSVLTARLPIRRRSRRLLRFLLPLAKLFFRLRCLSGLLSPDTVLRMTRSLGLPGLLAVRRLTLSGRVGALTSARGSPSVGAATHPEPQGCVAPRWTVVGAPAHWVLADVTQRVAARSFVNFVRRLKLSNAAAKATARTPLAPRVGLP